MTTPFNWQFCQMSIMPYVTHDKLGWGSHTVGVSPNRRERKKQATREALLDAALSLFADQGFAATTIEEIADAADVAPRTFFRYFPNKAAILYAPVEEYRATFRESLTLAPQDEPPLTSMHRALRETLVSLHDHRERIILQHRISYERDPDSAEEPMALWRAFESDVTSTLGVTEECAAVLTSVAVGIAMAAIHRWLTNDATGDLGVLTDDAFTELYALVGEATIAPD